MNVIVLHSERSNNEKLIRCIQNGFVHFGHQVSVVKQENVTSLANFEVAILLNKECFLIFDQHIFAGLKVYTMLSDTIVEDYEDDWRLFDRLLVFEQNLNYPRKSFPENITSFIKYYDVWGKSPDLKLPSSGKLLHINIERELSTTTYELARFANLTYQFDITYFTDKQVDLFRKGIHICKKNELDSHPNIFVGNNSHIVDTVLSGTPCVVAGNRGLGQTLCKETMYNHYMHSFEGRIGGELGEMIPPNLLSYQIEASINKSEQELQESKTSLLDIHTSIWFDLLTFLSKGVQMKKQINKDIDNVRFYFNTDFEAVTMGANSYYLLKKHLMKLHSSIDQEEMDMISSFNSPRKYSTLDEDDMEFVDDLIAEKILLPYGADFF